MGKIVEQYIKHDGRNLWDFEIVSQPGYENINRIHPLKQRDVGCFIKAIEQDCHILAIIVFGSAVRFDCHSRSDLDVLVVRDDRRLTIDGSLDEVSSELDVIFSSHLGSRLKEEIAQTGVVVYRRSSNV